MPEKLRNNWNNIMLRMQKASREYPGVVFVRVSVMVRDGNPFFWLPPETIPIEPKAEVGVKDLLGDMSEPQLRRVLELIYKLK